jgi:hypothetical protein
VVQGDHGYSLKTESETYPLEDREGLSQYVNKRVTVTGILEHQKLTNSVSEREMQQPCRTFAYRRLCTVVGRLQGALK